MPPAAASEGAGPGDGGSLRILTYSHDGFGLGHLRRNLKLAEGLCRRVPTASLLAATGSSVPHHFRYPVNADSVKLPSLAKVANERYEARSLPVASSVVVSMRAAILEAVVRTYQPELVIVDRYPLGVRGELRSAIEAARGSRPDLRMVLGLRDILDDPATIREEWQRNKYWEAVDAIYDLVLFYGQRNVFDPITEYALPPSLAERSRFTGYLIGADVEWEPDHVRARDTAGAEHLAVCTVGGGEDGRAIALAFLGAVGSLAHLGWQAVLACGPFMPVDEVERLRRTAREHRIPVVIMPFVESLPSYLNAADVVVSMGGYNTMCEVLALAVPCVVIPRTRPRTEQLMRAKLLAERGLVQMISPSDLDPKLLEEAMVAQSSLSREQIQGRVETELDTDGLDRAVEAILSVADQARRSR